MRPIAAYIYFSTEMIPKIKAKEGLSHPMAMKKAGEMWNSASEEERAPYIQKNLEDKER
jgi:hypothetical protein